MTKTERIEDGPRNTDEEIFRAAVLAQLKIAEREFPGGAAGLIEQLPREMQAVSRGVWEWADSRGVEV
jgi:hypothetical protein